ncbi:MAG: DUF4125 family protein [Candidatus Gastranaerophilales bacterium]|nr:DUF4125 family protein [Candidatus Gastranaerophilales bacterium]
MDISGILQRVDTLYEECRGPEAERLLQEAVSVALEEQDSVSLLQLLNELLGYYRETSQAEEAFAVAEQAIRVAENMGLAGTIPYATTLMNVANAYRAGGRLKDSLNCYLQVREIYEKLLAPDDLLTASLENNISLLYQEMGDFGRAKESLLKALPIVEQKKAAFEEAVTCANLAGTCIQLGEPQEAYAYAERAIKSFREQGVEDAHYCAALAAMGSYHFQRQEFEEAEKVFRDAMRIMEANLGKNNYYERLRENAEASAEAARQKAGQGTQASGRSEQEVRIFEQSGQGAQADEGMKGMELCREYYETFGRPMIEEQFADFADKIAVGLVGEGSDCFGYDDSFSRDHDWGPDFCMWVTDETYGQIGERLQRAYEALPDNFHGMQRTRSSQGQGRRGVTTVSAFYRRLLGTDVYEEIDWQQVPDAALAAAVNGEIFRDDEGIFTAFRRKLQEGYPETVRFLKLAGSAAGFSQNGQYNYLRTRRRGDVLTAQILLSDCIKEAMKLQHYIANVYPPHEKWMYKSLLSLKNGERTGALLRQMQEAAQHGEVAAQSGGTDAAQSDCRVQDLMEQLGAFLALEMYGESLISDIDPYLDAHTEELLQKSALSAKTDKELVEEIAKLEFEAFDKVKNEGGRADCQNDWATFSIMRKSQYLTWNRTMLLQYLFDFYREYRRGHNLITEKYGRMMESTAPEEYERIKDNFPVLTEEKRKIIEQVVAIQVGWMEEFAAKYPHLADNARSVHTYEDNLYNTSYETYLRGEVSTYSDKMLELYGRFIAQRMREGRNLAYDTMENSVHLYGYKSLEDAEKFLQ